MTATITPPSSPGAPRASGERPPRRPFRDNPRLILAGIVALAAALVLILAIANRTSGVSPDFAADVILYALTAADITMLVALAFVLARNIVKLVVERRRGLPFASFRAKLVALLLGMTLVPAGLVLIVGSELIRTNIDRWFNAPMDEVLASANRIASDYYRERQRQVRELADRAAARLRDADVLSSGDRSRIREHLSADVAVRQDGRLRVYQVAAMADTPAVDLLLDLPAGGAPPDANAAAAARLAVQAISGAPDPQAVEPRGASGELLHAAAVVRDEEGRARAVVVATDVLTGDVAAHSRRMTEAFESYNQLRVLKRPLTGVYLASFLMVTLLILMGAVWMGSYVAKRITRPVQMLAAAAREIGAGRLDQRIEPEVGDELGALTEAFNAMATDLQSTRRQAERSTLELERRHEEVEERRRYVETILERITTGVVSMNAAGTITTINSAAARLLDVDRSVVGQPAGRVFDRDDLQAVGTLIRGAARERAAPSAQEVAMSRNGLELHLAAVATALVGPSGVSDGVVLVLDDVTPLIRTQRVAAWREVARRLAHEIKNPLTPIQLSAERLRRHFSGAPARSRALVDECTSTIVGEVESLKHLVDEFSQFARMPSPRLVSAPVHELLHETLALYEGIFADVRIDRKLAPDVKLVRLDPEQMRRVIINLVDNAIEAMDRHGRIVVETQRDAAENLVRLVVADDGPGIPPQDRDRLFLPYYSTKRRGSGLGLAIVRRIIAEHGGVIQVSDNQPRGTRFTIELPS